MQDLKFFEKKEKIEVPVDPVSCKIINEYIENLRKGPVDVRNYIERYNGDKDSFISDLCIADLLEGFLGPNSELSHILPP